MLVKLFTVSSVRSPYNHPFINLPTPSTSSPIASPSNEAPMLQKLKDKMSSSKSLTFECAGEPPSSRTKTPPRITGHTSHETDHSITPPLIPRSPETLLPIDGDFDLNIAMPARPRKGSSGSRKNSGGSRENCQSSGLSGGDLKRRLEGISRGEE